MSRTMIYSDYTVDEYEECYSGLREENPDHTFSVEKAKVTLFGVEYPVIGILDETANEITILH